MIIETGDNPAGPAADEALDLANIVQSAAKDADTVKGYLSAFEQAGADEVICFPASADPAQVELLAQAAGL